MPNEEHHVDAGAGPSFEESDMSVRGTIIAGVVLFVVTAISFAVCVMFIKFLNVRDSMTDFEPSPLAGEHQEWDTEVRLQPNPPATLESHRAAQKAVAHAYGRVSEQPEIYRIPVETALEVVAEYGFPKFTMFMPPEGK